MRISYIRIWSGSGDKTLRIWNETTFECEHMIDTSDEISSLLSVTAAAAAADDDDAFVCVFLFCFEVYSLLFFPFTSFCFVIL